MSFSPCTEIVKIPLWESASKADLKLCKRALLCGDLVDSDVVSEKTRGVSKLINTQCFIVNAIREIFFCHNLILTEQWKLAFSYNLPIEIVEKIIETSAAINEKIFSNYTVGTFRSVETDPLSKNYPKVIIESLNKADHCLFNGFKYRAMEMYEDVLSEDSTNSWAKYRIRLMSKEREI